MPSPLVAGYGPLPCNLTRRQIVGKQLFRRGHANEHFERLLACLRLTVYLGGPK